jgi:ABC-type phosphate transport system auxiliary subunit
MDTTTQYKLNKYSKKISNAYKQHNMSKVNEYMHHQFNYINKYAQQQHGGDIVKEIQRLLSEIEAIIGRLNKKTQEYEARIQDISVLNQEIDALQKKSTRLGSSEA